VTLYTAQSLKVSLIEVVIKCVTLATIQHDTRRNVSCALKSRRKTSLIYSQQGTRKKQKNKEKLKTKIDIAQLEDTVRMIVRVVSPGEGRESTVRWICETGGF